MYVRGLSLPKEEISVARAPQMILWMYFRPIASTLYISLSVQFPELQFKREPKQTQMILWLIFFSNIPLSVNQQLVIILGIPSY